MSCPFLQNLLSRFTLLAPIIAIVSVAVGGSGKGEGVPVWRRLSLPWFITAFLAVVVLNSMITLPHAFTQNALSVSKGLLLAAVTATAMRSRMDLLMEMGWRATIPVITATLASFATALLLVMFWL